MIKPLLDFEILKLKLIVRNVKKLLMVSAKEDAKSFFVKIILILNSGILNCNVLMLIILTQYYTLLAVYYTKRYVIFSTDVRWHFYNSTLV